MTDKLIAIVRFKHLPRANPTTRFGVFQSAGRLCGPASAASGCAFYKLDAPCQILCNNLNIDQYYLRVAPKSGRFVVRAGKELLP